MENPDTEKRIKTFVECNDGFILAEKDLELRGPGNLFSTQQHGMPPLRIADLVRDANLLERTREDARALIEKDPELKGAEFERLRNMVIVRYGPSLGLSDVG
jgi:ATP-dependent DNA helicase RecG